MWLSQATGVAVGGPVSVPSVFLFWGWSQSLTLKTLLFWLYVAVWVNYCTYSNVGFTLVYLSWGLWPPWTGGTALGRGCGRSLERPALVCAVPVSSQEWSRTRCLQAPTLTKDVGDASLLHLHIFTLTLKNALVHLISFTVDARGPWEVHLYGCEFIQVRLSQLGGDLVELGPLC